jgi:hypothetical protein
VSLGLSPRKVTGNGPSRITVKGRATFTGTGRPIAGLRLLIASDASTFSCETGTPVVTDSRGYYSRSLPYTPGSEVHVTAYVGKGQYQSEVSCRWKHPEIVPTLTASLRSARIRLGQSVQVQGTTLPDYSTEVDLQRQNGKVWQTVAKRVQVLGTRYTLTDKPLTPGVQHYRVFRPRYPDLHIDSAVSRVLAVNVVRSRSRR